MHTLLVTTPQKWRFRSAVFAGLLLSLLLSITSTTAIANKGASLNTEAFLSAHFSTAAQQQPKVLWVTGALRERVESLLNHRFGVLRVRYWGEGSKTAWILDEIGKEAPITIGVVINQEGILEVRILEYRESRGGEVRYTFFTRQFQKLALKESMANKQDKLNARIDGITGATLSVTAVKKIATLALIFHQQTPFATK